MKFEQYICDYRKKHRIVRIMSFQNPFHFHLFLFVVDKIYGMNSVISQIFKAMSILYRFGACIEKHITNLNDRRGRIVNKVRIDSEILGMT